MQVFIKQEDWASVPRKTVDVLLKSPKFIVYVDKLSPKMKLRVLKQLSKLQEEGWDVLAPMGHIANVLSKTNTGQKLIVESKIGLARFEKLKPIAKFLEKHPMAREGLAYGGDALTITSNAYSEYTNPKSPAYGKADMALYGGINLFFLNAGPLEGAQYGGFVGAIAGTTNYLLQGGGFSDIPLINKLEIVKNSDLWHTTISEKDKRKWLDKQYKEYGQPHGSPMDKNYRTGVQPESGSPNFNPKTNKEIKIK